LKIRVRNLTRDTLLGDQIDVADTSSTRRTGLLKHATLDDGTGLWIVPCESVHTFFMKFAIDVVYLDRKKRVKKAVGPVVPWRLSMCFLAYSLLELPAGSIERTGTRKGDELEFVNL
jgi:uncharacterized membrane protein (UPF0127 family)